MSCEVNLIILNPSKAYLIHKSIEIVQRLNELHLLYEISVLPVHSTVLFPLEKEEEIVYIVSGSSSIPRI